MLPVSECCVTNTVRFGDVKLMPVPEMSPVAPVTVKLPDAGLMSMLPDAVMLPVLLRDCVENLVCVALY